MFADPGEERRPAAPASCAAASGITVSKYNSALDAMKRRLRRRDRHRRSHAAGRRRGVHRRRRSHHRRDQRQSHTVEPRARPQGQQRRAEQPHHAASPALGKPTVVVVLEGGSIIDMPWFVERPGGGDGLVPGHGRAARRSGRLLFGDVNFSGKLPVTWDTIVSHWPTFAADDQRVQTQMDYCLGYRYFDHQGRRRRRSSRSATACRTRRSSTRQPAVSRARRCAGRHGPRHRRRLQQQRGRRDRDGLPVRPVSRARRSANRAGASYKELKGFNRVSLAARGSGDAADHDSAAGEGSRSTGTPRTNATGRSKPER